MSEILVGNKEFLNEPGDVITEEVIITNTSGLKLDIRNFCRTLTLFEDIFSNVLMGTAVVFDSNNLISKIPFKGDEYLTISYRTPGFKEKISKSFYITKVDDRQFIATDRQSLYSLSFMSIEGFQDNIKDVSKKYSGSTDTIVRRVFTDYLKTPRSVISGGETPTFFKDKLSSHATIVVPSWNPLKTINWAAARSFISGTSAPNFLFFESNKGFYFNSIEQLIKQQRETKQIFAEYTYSPTANKIENVKNSNYTYTKPELTKQFNIVRKMNAFRQYDVIEGQDYGYYASKLISIDLGLKVAIEFENDYHKKFTTFEHLEKPAFQTFSNNLRRNPESYKVVLNKHFRLHNDAKDPQYEKWALERNSLLYEISKNLRIELEVPGRTDIEVGRLINFLYPKNIDKTDGNAVEDTFDPYMSGLYLVTAIRHEFNLNKHTMFLEVTKDSFKKSVD
jgi:hypothetical protein